MEIPKLKEVVSRRGIQEEIEKVRKQLSELEPRLKGDEYNALVRQTLQLEALECILFDYHLIP